MAHTMLVLRLEILILSTVHGWTLQRLLETRQVGHPIFAAYFGAGIFGIGREPLLPALYGLMGWSGTPFLIGAISLVWLPGDHMAMITCAVGLGRWRTAKTTACGPTMSPWDNINTLTGRSATTNIIQNHFKQINGTSTSNFEAHLSEVVWRSWQHGSQQTAFLRLLQKYHPLTGPPLLEVPTPLFPSWKHLSGKVHTLAEELEAEERGEEELEDEMGNIWRDDDDEDVPKRVESSAQTDNETSDHQEVAPKRKYARKRWQQKAAPWKKYGQAGKAKGAAPKKRRRGNTGSVRLPREYPVDENGSPILPGKPCVDDGVKVSSPLPGGQNTPPLGQEVDMYADAASPDRGEDANMPFQAYAGGSTPDIRPPQLRSSPVHFPSPTTARASVVRRLGEPVRCVRGLASKVPPKPRSTPTTSSTPPAAVRPLSLYGAQSDFSRKSPIKMGVYQTPPAKKGPTPKPHRPAQVVPVSKVISECDEVHMCEANETANKKPKKRTQPAGRSKKKSPSPQSTQSFRLSPEAQKKLDTLLADLSNDDIMPLVSSPGGHVVTDTPSTGSPPAGQPDPVDRSTSPTPASGPLLIPLDSTLSESDHDNITDYGMPTSMLDRAYSDDESSDEPTTVHESPPPATPTPKSSYEALSHQADKSCPPPPRHVRDIKVKDEKEDYQRAVIPPELIELSSGDDFEPTVKKNVKKQVDRGPHKTGNRLASKPKRLVVLTLSDTSDSDLDETPLLLRISGHAGGHKEPQTARQRPVTGDKVNMKGHKRPADAHLPDSPADSPVFRSHQKGSSPMSKSQQKGSSPLSKSRPKAPPPAKARKKVTPPKPKGKGGKKRDATKVHGKCPPGFAPHRISTTRGADPSRYAPHISQSRRTTRGAETAEVEEAVMAVRQFKRQERLTQPQICLSSDVNSQSEEEVCEDEFKPVISPQQKSAATSSGASGAMQTRPPIVVKSMCLMSKVPHPIEARAIIIVRKDPLPVSNGQKLPNARSKVTAYDHNIDASDMDWN